MVVASFRVQVYRLQPFSTKDSATRVCHLKKAASHQWRGSDLPLSCHSVVMPLFNIASAHGYWYTSSKATCTPCLLEWQCGHDGREDTRYAKILPLTGWDTKGQREIIFLSAILGKWESGHFGNNGSPDRVTAVAGHCYTWLYTYRGCRSCSAAGC